MGNYIFSLASTRPNKKKRAASVVAAKYVLDLYLISAEDLKHELNSCFGGSSFCTYAVAWVESHDRKLRTSVDEGNGQNPSWNAHITLSMDAKLLEKETTAVTIEIYSQGCVWDNLLGTVRILLSDLIKSQRFVAGKCLTFMVVRPSGRRQGQLNLGILPSAHHFVDSFRKDKTPMHAAGASCMER